MFPNGDTLVICYYTDVILSSLVPIRFCLVMRCLTFDILLSTYTQGICAASNTQYMACNVVFVIHNCFVIFSVWWSNPT